MEFDVAARAAEKINNGLKKFAQAQEVLEAAVNAEASLSILTPKLINAQAALADLQKQYDDQLAKNADAMLGWEAAMAESKRAFDEEMDAMKAKARAELETIKVEIKAAASGYSRVIAKRKAILADLDGKMAEAEGRLLKAQDTLASLKANL